ncbi:MAG: OB-fold nucleic acid binding domain-containing protein, partial [Chloroflexi bacterium]|nr:OB-fold nucleic acid binding domain-containing protein [Chloroflexota bacterium]
MNGRGRGRDRGRSSLKLASDPGTGQATDSLRNVLELERKLEFADRAVMGGLDRFIEQVVVSLPWIRDVEPLRGTSYAALQPGQRHRWAAAVMGKIGNAPAPPASGKSRPPGQNTTRPPTPRTTYALDTPLAELKFIHQATRGKLSRLDVKDLRDMLWLFPNRHVDYSKVTKIVDVEYGASTTVAGRVVRTEKVRIGPPPGAAKILINDGTGLLEATFFRQAYLADRFKRGSVVAFSGEIGAFRNRALMQNPEYDELPSSSISGSGSGFPETELQLTHAGNLLPVYPST